MIMEDAFPGRVSRLFTRPARLAIRILLYAGVWIAFRSAEVRAAPVPETRSASGPADSIGSPVVIGIQTTHYFLKTPRKREYNEDGKFVGGFIGSIDQLHARQRYTPTPFLRLTPTRYAGLQLGYAAMDAATSTFWDGHTDGAFHLKGLTLELFFRHKFKSGLAPYAAVGGARLSARFAHDELWHNGFSPNHPEAYRNWVADGRPSWPNRGYRRTIEPRDTTAWYIAGGCSYDLSPNWVIHLGARHMTVDMEADYYVTWYGQNRRDYGTHTIPFDNWALLLGIHYDW